MVDDTSFAAALDDALRRRGVGLTWVRDRLAARGHRVSLGALSYWRSGGREPTRGASIEAVRELEAVLDVPDGALTSRLRRSNRPAPSPFDDLVGLARAAGRDRGLVGEGAVDRLSLDLVVDVDRDRRVTSVRVTQLFEAAADGATGVTMFVAPGVAAGETGYDELVDLAGDTVLRAVSGCAVEDVSLLVDGISAATLRFERPLALGELLMTEVVLVPMTDESALDAEWGAVAEQRLEHCSVWVRFDPAALPRRVWTGFQEAGVDHEEESDLAGATGLLNWQAGFGPGLCTARWAW
ncbi:MAG: hypothetical protein PGN15_06340 [Aeromicrobium erythreum]